MNKKNRCADFITDLEQQILTVYEDPTLARQYAWWTLETITGQSKTALIVQGSLALTAEQEARLAYWIEQLIDKKMPIAYLIGSVPFCDVDILVEPPTLIPRPETEEWCGNLIEQLKKLSDVPLKILDLCCGSGCIGVALAYALPHAQVYAVDSARAAIALTQKNAQHNGVANLTIIQSDLFQMIPVDVQFDLIVTNPPYIAPSEWADLDISVAAWEDKNALIAPDEGLAIIKRIIAETPAYIRKNDALEHAKVPQLMIEIGYQQGAVVAELMRQAGYNQVIVHKDLEKKDRVVSGRVGNVEKYL